MKKRIFFKGNCSWTVVVVSVFVHQGVRKTPIPRRTWLVGSPRRWQMWGTILLSVRLWDPNLLTANLKKTYSIWTYSTYTQSANGWCGAYTFKVEMRQRQRPSLVLLFLCLKPPIIRSHTYWNEQMHEFNVNVKRNHWQQNRTEQRRWLITCGLAAWSMIFRRRAWSWSRTWSFASPSRSMRLGRTERQEH